MELLTVKQVSEELDISERRVRQLCQDGRFGERYGWQWLITRDELEEFQKTRRLNPGRPPKDE